MEVKVINEVMPVIEINFEQIKTNLTDTLRKYNGIIVTEETLSGCKATQKNLRESELKSTPTAKTRKKNCLSLLWHLRNNAKN